MDLTKLQLFKTYQKARDAFNQHQYHTCCELLLKVLPQTKNSDINHLLARALYRDQHYSQAKKIIELDLDSYRDDENSFRLMLRILLKNCEFIRCREIAVTIKDPHLAFEIRDLIHKSEAADLKKDPKKIQKMANQFYHLANQSLIHQRMVFARALTLPGKEFVSIAVELLNDPFLKPIMRLSVLDTLRKLRFSQNVRYRWLNNKIYDLKPASLLDLVNMRSYQQVMQIVETEYAENPTDMLLLLQNLRLELSYLYPFNDQVIQNPRLWVKIAALRIKGQQPDLNQRESRKIYEWQVKLNHLTQNLVK